MLEPFAETFAHRTVADEDRDMLVGFCLLVRRSAWEAIRERDTGQGFDERFGLSTYEDNDLCYRLRRAGYRLTLSTRAFVHHGGSKTIHRVSASLSALMNHNKALYEAKWKGDRESGFASTLSGLYEGPIVFDWSRCP